MIKMENSDNQAVEETKASIRKSPLISTNIAPATICTTPPAQNTLSHRIGQRIADIIVSILVLILSLPIMIAIGVLIKLDSPGPALFVQMRMTKNRRVFDNRDAENECRRKDPIAGKLFKFVKFRTMYIDARERFPELYHYEYDKNVLNEFKFKSTNDPRVTRVGSWLRKTSLDELPNFWNVLTGDMTLVGPRPEIPEMSRYYEGEYLRKFDVKSGITGPAQVEGRGHLSFMETINHDLNYVKKRSFLNDIKLLLKTVVAVIKGKGAF